MEKDVFTIIVGGNMDSDWEYLLSGKNARQEKNSLYLNSFEELHELLSPKRISLLHYLMRHQNQKKPKSISQVAAETHRFQEAVSKDIKHLAGLGLVEIKKEKQIVYAYPKHKKISIKA